MSTLRKTHPESQKTREPVLDGSVYSSFYWAWSQCALHVLIPAQNGKKWLRCPAGHHQTSRISEIEYAAKCDVCGLDGTLDFDCGMQIGVYLEKRREFEKRVFPAIERLYKCKQGWEVSYGAIADILRSVLT